MSYETYRVEITRDEWKPAEPVTIEVTAYIDRVPETDAPTRGMLSRAAKGVWNSRLQMTGDFETLKAALAAIDDAYPEAVQIRCYEYTVDDRARGRAAGEIRRQMGAERAVLTRTGASPFRAMTP